MRNASIWLAILAIVCGCAWGDSPPQRVARSELDRYWKTGQVLSPEYAPQAIMARFEGCYVVEYTIDASGSAQDAHVTFSDVSMRQRDWPGAKRRDVAKFKQATADAQEQAVLRAVNALRYEPGPDNTARSPVVTHTRPIVITVLSIRDADDPKGIASEESAMRARREASVARCSAAEPTPAS